MQCAHNTWGGRGGGGGGARAGGVGGGGGGGARAGGRQGGGGNVTQTRRKSSQHTTQPTNQRTGACVRKGHRCTLILRLPRLHGNHGLRWWQRHGCCVRFDLRWRGPVDLTPLRVCDQLQQFFGPCKQTPSESGPRPGAVASVSSCQCSLHPCICHARQAPSDGAGPGGSRQFQAQACGGVPDVGAGDRHKEDTLGPRYCAHRLHGGRELCPWCSRVS